MLIFAFVSPFYLLSSYARPIRLKILATDMPNSKPLRRGAFSKQEVQKRQLIRMPSIVEPKLSFFRIHILISTLVVSNAVSWRFLLSRNPVHFNDPSVTLSIYNHYGFIVPPFSPLSSNPRNGRRVNIFIERTTAFRTSLVYMICNDNCTTFDNPTISRD